MTGCFSGRYETENDRAPCDHMPNSSIAAEPRSTEKRRRVLLGEITGVHGIRGEVVLRTYTADPFDIGAYGPLASEAGDASFEIRVLRAGAR